MDISKYEKILYFSDEEIDNETNGEKKVFVAKRINGKESHAKVKKNTGRHMKQKEQDENEGFFNFNDQVVIGVNEKDNKKEKRSNKGRRKREKRRKNKVRNYENLNNNRNRKQKINKMLMALLTGIALITVVIIFALAAPIFDITDIQVKENETVSSDTIIRLSTLKKGENIFRFNNEIKEKIKENAYIESVEIERKLPSTVIISVKERVVKYQINLINSYAYMDQNGYVLANSTIKKDVPVIVGLSITEDQMLNKERLKENDLEKLNEISKIIDVAKTINIDNIITEINIENEKDYVLYLESKNKKIHIGNTSNLTNKMLYIQKILENEEGKSGTAFVNGDINAGFKPYFREE